MKPNSKKQEYEPKVTLILVAIVSVVLLFNALSLFSEYDVRMRSKGFATVRRTLIEYKSECLRFPTTVEGLEALTVTSDCHEPTSTPSGYIFVNGHGKSLKYESDGVKVILKSHGYLGSSEVTEEYLNNPKNDY